MLPQAYIPTAQHITCCSPAPLPSYLMFLICDLIVIARVRVSSTICTYGQHENIMPPAMANVGGSVKSFFCRVIFNIYFSICENT